MTHSEHLAACWEEEKTISYHDTELL